MVIAALKSVHESVQSRAAEVTAVETFATTGTWIQEEENHWQDVEHSQHDHCQDTIREVFPAK